MSLPEDETPPDENQPAAEEAQPEAAAEAPPEPEAAPEAEPAAAEPEAPAPAQEELSPKERRRRARVVHTEARPSRSPEERQAERAQERARKRQRRQTGRPRTRAKRNQSAQASPPLPLAPEQPAGRPKVRQGVVVSDKADKTITVRIDIARRHRRYQKVVHTTRTLHAHDEANEAHQGDTVRVVESRPTSRTKRWRLVDVLERAQ